MNLNTKILGNIILLNLTGRFDVALSSDIEKQIYNIINKEADKHLLLNLKEVEYMNSSMIGIIMSIKDILQERKKTVKFCNMNNAVRVVFEVLELEEMFEIFDSEEDAIASFSKV